MSRVCFCLLGFFAAVGCDLLNPTKVDNPVFGPPPPRVRASNDGLLRDKYAKNTLRAKADKEGRVQPVGFSSSRDRALASGELADAQVVATVNGSPVFASEVLEPLGAQLRNARKQLNDEQYQKLREEVLQRYLKDFVQRKLLAEALKATLDKDQMARLEGAVDGMFKDHVEKLKKEFKVNTEYEVELELNKRQNTTLAKLKDGFRMQAMAGAYLEGKAQSEKSLGRPELLAYYEEHRSDYEYPEKVRWQQLSMSFDKNGGREGALKKLEKAVAELREGADFGDVVRKYSDGANAEKGGDFGWSQPESLADAKIAKALGELPENVISRVLETKDSLRLVKINKRKPAGRVPFADVQGKIKAKLEGDAQKEATQKLLEDLSKDAIVETIFDEK
jgi:hypothetical protein